MCWVAAIPVAITAAKGIASAVGGYQEAKAKNQSLEYTAQVALNNANIKMTEARYAQGQAVRNAVEERKKTSYLISAQRAKMGASGAVVDSGSFLDVTLSTREEGEKTAVGLLQQGDIEAWHHGLEAGNYREEARLARRSKLNTRSVLTGGLLSAGAQTVNSAFSSGLLSGARAVDGA